MSKRESKPSWWMEAEQECFFCFSDYAVLAEIYCAECDRPVCPMCVVVIHASNLRFICPDCNGESTPAGDE